MGSKNSEVSLEDSRGFDLHLSQTQSFLLSTEKSGKLTSN